MGTPEGTGGVGSEGASVPPAATTEADGRQGHHEGDRDADGRTGERGVYDGVGADALGDVEEANRRPIARASEEEAAVAQ